MTKNEYAATLFLKFHYISNIQKNILLPYLLENDDYLEI